MTKTTRISGVDNKIGRNSRTGSTVTFTVEETDIIDVSQYFADIRSNREPIGKIKKIELIMYTEDDLKEVVELPSTKELDLQLSGNTGELEIATNEYGTKVLSQNEIDEILTEPDKENLPANQLDLKLYEEKEDD